MRSETTAPTRVGEYLVPPGVVVWPMIYALQNAAHNWEDAAAFKPVRVRVCARQHGTGGGGHRGCAH